MYATWLLPGFENMGDKVLETRTGCYKVSCLSAKNLGIIEILVGLTPRAYVTVCDVYSLLV